MTHTHVAAYPLSPSVRDRPQVAHPPAPGLKLLRFAAVMAMLLAAAAFLQSSFLTVSDITIAGANRISPDDILARSSLRVGQRLATVDAARVVEQLMQHPWVDRAHLDVSPAGHVIIRIQERVPYAALPYRDGHLLLDQTGVALAVVHGTPPVPVVVADGPALRWVRIGDRIPSASLLDAMRVLAALPEDEVARGLRLRVERAGSVMLTTADDVTVLLGAPPGLIGRIASLPQVLSAIRRRGLGVRYVDLRFAGSVILKQGAPPSRGGVRH